MSSDDRRDEQIAQLREEVDALTGIVTTVGETLTTLAGIAEQLAAMIVELRHLYEQQEGSDTSGGRGEEPDNVPEGTPSAGTH